MNKFKHQNLVREMFRGLKLEASSARDGIMSLTVPEN